VIVEVTILLLIITFMYANKSVVAEAFTVQFIVDCLYEIKG